MSHLSHLSPLSHLKVLVSSLWPGSQGSKTERLSVQQAAFGGWKTRTQGGGKSGGEADSTPSNFKMKERIRERLLESTTRLEKGAKTNLRSNPTNLADSKGISQLNAHRSTLPPSRLNFLLKFFSSLPNKYKATGNMYSAG